MLSCACLPPIQGQKQARSCVTDARPDSLPKPRGAMSGAALLCIPVDALVRIGSAVQCSGTDTAAGKVG